MCNSLTVCVSIYVCRCKYIAFVCATITIRVLTCVYQFLHDSPINMAQAGRGRALFGLITPDTPLSTPEVRIADHASSIIASKPEHPGGVRPGYSWQRDTPVRSGGVDTRLTGLKPGKLEVPGEPHPVDGAKAAARHTGAQRGASSLLEETSHGELDGRYLDMECHGSIPTEISEWNGVSMQTVNTFGGLANGVNTAGRLFRSAGEAHTPAPPVLRRCDESSLRERRVHSERPTEGRKSGRCEQREFEACCNSQQVKSCSGFRVRRTSRAETSSDYDDSSSDGSSPFRRNRNHRRIEQSRGRHASTSADRSVSPKQRNDGRVGVSDRRRQSQTKHHVAVGHERRHMHSPYESDVNSTSDDDEFSGRRRQKRDHMLQPCYRGPVSTKRSDIRTSTPRVYFETGHRGAMRTVMPECGNKHNDSPKWNSVAAGGNVSSVTRCEANQAANAERYTSREADGTSSMRRPAVKGDSSVSGTAVDLAGAASDRSRLRPESPPEPTVQSAGGRSKPAHYMKPNKFDGNTSIDTFLIQFETAADYNMWTSEEKCANLKCCLSGQTGQILWETGSPESITYSQLVDKLKARYGSAGQKELFITQLRTRKRKQHESLADLHRDIRRLMALAYPNTSGSDLNEEIGKTHFIEALGNRNLELKIREREPPTLDAAFALAVRLEAYQAAYGEEDMRDGRHGRARCADGQGSRVATIGHGPRKNEAVEREIAELRKALDSERGEREKLTRELGRLQLLDEQRKAHEGLGLANTRQPVVNSSESPPARPGRDQQGRVRCYRCNGMGHYARDCSAAPMGSGSAQQQTTLGSVQQEKPSNSSQVRGTVSGRSVNETYLRMTIGGKQVDCLLDTGSDVCLLPTRVVGRVAISPTSQTLLAANGTDIRVRGEINVEAMIGEYIYDVRAFVCDQVSDAILGMDFLRQYEALWDFGTGQINLGGISQRLMQKGKASWVRRIIAVDTVEVPPLSECVLPGNVLFRCAPNCSQGSSWMTKSGELPGGLRVSRTLLPERTFDVPVRVLNITNRKIRVRAGSVLADLEPADLEDTEVHVAVPLISERQVLVDELVGRVDEAVPTEIREQLQQALVDYSGVFSTGENDLGRTSIARHEIDTGDARPIRQPLRRHPPAHQTAIREHVTQMLQQGIIEPAQSPWASNIVLVKKKDGSLRCCVDYRHLNSVTRKDAYPLPRTDACLDAMAGAQWFSTFDFRSSYHQVEVRPEDADKTAFICRDGLFRFKTMPFGLCGAPATFQRLMDLVMAGLNFDICLVYLDDIIVFSSTLEHHLQRLRLVLDRIQKSGLKLKSSKCHLFQRSVDFLGHTVSYRGIEPQTEKVSAVVEWPEPTNLRELRAFLGLCGYYRRFVERFSERAGALYDLLEKGRKYEFSPACRAAFNDLKTALTSAPILAMPTESDRMILDTDASNEAIGAILSQVQGEHERVIAYASRRLSPAERNYCITRRELLAVVAFIKQFRPYLLGRRFTVRTDHAALQWLRRVPEPIGQQARWLEQLEEYEFDVVHRAGTRHGNADAMSRRPCDRNRCCRQTEVNGTEQTVVARVETIDEPLQCLMVNTGPLDDQNESTGWTAEEIAKSQETDPDIGPIVELLKCQSDKPKWDMIVCFSEATKSLWRQWDRLRMFRGVLMRRFENADGRIECKQILMPRNKRSEFVRLIHEGPSGGHLGRTRTRRQVQLRAYWPGWSADVSEVLRKCTPCSRYHRGAPPKQTPLKPFVAGEPWEVVSIDITGPHPRSWRGHVYILTVVDHFSKWAEALPIRNHTATTVARALFDHVFSRFGMPSRVLSDQGAEFESTLFSQLCQLMAIDKVRTTPYKPSTNATVERFHRTLNAMLAKVVCANQRDWCDHLPGVMTAYRASVHESTRFSPNRVMFGRENRLPVDVVMGDVREDSSEQNMDDYVAKLCERMHDDFTLVRDHLGDAARRRKDKYDVGVRKREFQPGQLVWYYYPRRRQGLSAKWQNFYIGPYEVIRLLDSHNVVIRKNKRSKCLIVHRDKLKPCFGEACENNETPKYPTVVQEPEVAVADNGQTPSHCDNSVVLPAARNRVNAEWHEDADTMRPKRQIKQPAYLKDYHVSFVCRSIQAMSNRQVWQAKREGCYCEACGRGFSKRSSLKRHLEATKDRQDHNAEASVQLAAWRPRGRPAGDDDSRTVVKRPRKVGSTPVDPGLDIPHDSSQQRPVAWRIEHRTQEPENTRRQHMVRTITVARRSENSVQHRRDKRRRLGWGRSWRPVLMRQHGDEFRRPRTPSRPPSRTMVTTAYKSVTGMLKHSDPSSLTSILAAFQGTETNLKPGQVRAACAASVASILLSVEVMSGKSVEGLQATDLTKWTMAVRDQLSSLPPTGGTITETDESTRADCYVEPETVCMKAPADLPSEEKGMPSLTIETSETVPARTETTTEELTDMDLFEESIIEQYQRISVELHGDIAEVTEIRDTEVAVRADDLELQNTAMSGPLREQPVVGQLIGSESHSVLEPKVNDDNITETHSGTEIGNSGFDEVTMIADKCGGDRTSDAPVIPQMRAIDRTGTDETTLSSLEEHHNAPVKFPALHVSMPQHSCALSETPPFTGSGRHTANELCLHVELRELAIPKPPPVSAELDDELRKMAMEPRESVTPMKETVASSQEKSDPGIIVSVRDSEPWQATQGRIPTNKVFVTPGQKKFTHPRLPVVSPRLDATRQAVAGTSKSELKSSEEGTGRGNKKKDNGSCMDKKSEVRREGSSDTSAFASALSASQEICNQKSSSKSVIESKKRTYRPSAESKFGKSCDRSKNSRNEDTSKPKEKRSSDKRTSDEKREGTSTSRTTKCHKVVDSSKAIGKAESKVTAELPGSTAHKAFSSKKDIALSSAKTASSVSQEAQIAVPDDIEPNKESGRGGYHVSIEHRIPASGTFANESCGIGSVTGFTGSYGQLPPGPGWMQPWSPYWMMPPPWWGPPTGPSSGSNVSWGWPWPPAMQPPTSFQYGAVGHLQPSGQDDRREGQARAAASNQKKREAQ